VSAAFVVTLREGFEAALLLGIVYTYLHQIGATRSYRYATRGAVLGALASAALGAAVSFVSGPLLDRGPDLIGVVVAFVAVVVLTWHGYWMRRHARAVKGDVQRRIDEAQRGRRLWVVGVIAFAGVFREGAETVLFLWGLVVQAAAPSGWAEAAGGLLGLAAAAALGWAIFRGGTRVSLPRFFAVTAVLLLLVAAGLFSTGVGKLEALGVLPQTGIAWDSSRLLSDEGLVGGFLGGLVGYRARPSMLEAAAAASYLLLAGALLVGPFRGLAGGGQGRPHHRDGTGVLGDPPAGAGAGQGAGAGRPRSTSQPR
jgi:high-affinity iron transporter